MTKTCGSASPKKGLPPSSCPNTAPNSGQCTDHAGPGPATQESKDHCSLCSELPSRPGSCRLAAAARGAGRAGGLGGKVQARPATKTLTRAAQTASRDAAAGERRWRHNPHLSQSAAESPGSNKRCGHGPICTGRAARGHFRQ